MEKVEEANEIVSHDRVTKMISNAMLSLIMSYSGFLQEARPIIKQLNYAGYMMA